MPWKQVAAGGEVYVPEYRVEPRDDGYEPQMRYQVAGKDLWLPLNEEGYVLQPEIWNDANEAVITKHIVLSAELAQRAVTCARRINGEQVIRNVSPEDTQP